jgi:8-oxo-dGTP pyrophosphatase MutT (NUDIX family)
MEQAPIPAATVILLRDQPRFETLMIARHQGSAFAGGALVFPGGRVDPGDRDPAWRAAAEGLSAAPDVAAAQVAAIREAFEEVGVLLARGADGAFADGQKARRFGRHRRAVEREDRRFLDLIRDEGLALACDELRLFAHWIAPPGLHRRFDTLFFAARFPAGQDVLEDGDEATEAVWIAPEEALAARAEGRRKIIFPTARNLELLALSHSVGDVFGLAARRPIRPVTPRVERRVDGVFLTIPEGLGYPVLEEPFESASVR